MLSECTPPPLLIRADATTHIGHGHVMRCLALSEAAKNHGSDVVFLSHCQSSSLRQKIESEGIRFILLDRPHPHPSDIDKTLKTLTELLLAHTQRPWLILDGYHFDSSYQRELHTTESQILVIDDMAHLEYYYSDLLLNQNINALSLTYQCDEHTVLLLGPRYALLRSEFSAWRGWKRKLPRVACKVMVTLGGGDPANVTRRVIKMLQRVDVAGLEATVLAGSNNPNLDKLHTICETSTFPTHLMTDAHNISELMAWADLCISAGGSTCLELAYMGLPNLVIILADNQQNIAEGLDESGIAINLGWHNEINDYDFLEKLGDLMCSQELRKSMSEKGRRLIDGRGVDRVLSMMINHTDQILPSEHLEVRLASHRDAELLWKWANDPSVRANSFNQEPISLDVHMKWLSNKLTSADARIWILVCGRAPVAQIRYDRIDEHTAEISFSVAKEYRGKGLGTKALLLTSNRACSELGVRRLKGISFISNKASVGAFTKAGFELLGLEDIEGKPCNVFVKDCQHSAKKEKTDEIH